jgi:lipoate-protein ligase A
MVRVLKVPDEKFRDKVHQTLRDNLSTIRRELGSAPPPEELWDLLAQEFSELLGPLPIETEVDAAWRAQADALAARMLSDEWLYRKGRPKEGRTVTIRSGLEIRQKAYKAPGGLIRATMEVQDDVIVAVSLSGDFFFYPAQRLTALEAALAGVRVDKAEQAVARFYDQHRVESPGVTPGDFARVLG